MDFVVFEWWESLLLLLGGFVSYVLLDLFSECLRKGRL